MTRKAQRLFRGLELNIGLICDCGTTGVQGLDVGSDGLGCNEAFRKADCKGGVPATSPT